MAENSIRRMTAADLPLVLSIEARGHAFPWTEGNFRDGLESGYYMVVMEQQGKLIGYGVVQIILDEGHLLNITIDPKLNGRGLGRELLLHLLDHARTHTDTLFLEVRPSNSRAIALYQTSGFNEIGLRRNYYPAKDGGREDALLMAMAF
ncbi:MAG: ribosomal protein S18-alanine N-acetyltransferase [Pedobacter sp.]|nr:ribosomal protein S18-alanine N-acetyltransferase [Pedobacter sp.]